MMSDKGFYSGFDALLRSKEISRNDIVRSCKSFSDPTLGRICRGESKLEEQKYYKVAELAQFLGFDSPMDLINAVHQMESNHAAYRPTYTKRR